MLMQRNVFQSHAVSPKLLQVEVPAVGLKKCKVYYMKHKYVITSNMVCAGNRGHDSCQVLKFYKKILGFMFPNRKVTTGPLNLLRLLFRLSKAHLLSYVKIDLV